jgi:hypothetical protein
VRDRGCVSRAASFVGIDQTWLARSGGFAPISLPLFQGSLLDGIASLSFMIGLLITETDQSGPF